MFVSLSSRLIGIAALVVVALCSLAGLLADAYSRTEDGFRWVSHSAIVIESTEAALGALRDAESGQRGFIITHDPSYTRSFNASVFSATAQMAAVVERTGDNPRQRRHARDIARLMAQRIVVLRGVLDLARRGRFDAAVAGVGDGRGQRLMDAINVRAQSFLDEERTLQSSRVAAANERLAAGRWLAVAGAVLVGVFVALLMGLTVRRLNRSLATMMRAMTDLGKGDLRARIDPRMGSREFSRLARGHNAMADRLEHALADQAASEQRLQVVNAELSDNSETLRARGDVIGLLGGMAHRMQAARTDDELAQIIGVFVPRVLPGVPGALYAHNNSRNLLVPVAHWGGMEVGEESFAPDQCWALRRGQSHSLVGPGSDIVCEHAAGQHSYHCEPLLAGGEVIGVLYLLGRIEEESLFRLKLLSENIASALVNHRLQRSLREQTIRDPLTNLFNRRYMEEALKLEIARAARGGAPLSLVMCDVDHFKRFNDDFGHDAGDAVLQAVAAEMRSRFRDGDLVCRFGGEEFAVIAPGTSAEALKNRVEIVRQAISELNVVRNGQTLGATSMSFGIASWSASMAKDGSTLVQLADAALYEAKRAGRNRATVSRLAA